ncbi:MAG: glycosyltransferase [Pyrinomonadaceae bacterium]
MNILAVSMAFPPLAYPRSIQVARLLKNTEDAIVLFCADESEARIDHSIEPDAEERLTDCIRIPVPGGSRISSLVDRFTYRFARGMWNQNHLVPDTYGNWRDDVAAAVPRYLDDTGFRPDVIVTFAQPFSVHLIGMGLKQRFGLPWLAHFSDPWADNPFTPFDERTRNWNLQMEGRVAENADMLVFTSTETVELFFRKYPAALRKKARVLPQCFDPLLYSGTAAPSGTLKVRYLGNFYGRRTPRPLIAGLTRLYSEKPGLLANISFELIGSGDQDETARLAARLPAGLINARSSVSYRESLDLMTTSDGLLILDAPADLSVFLPSKLIDYIGAGRPILGITPEGTAAGLIRELGGSVADPENLGEIASVLEKFIEVLAANRGKTGESVLGTAEVRERFTAKRVAGDFSSMLKELKVLH